MKHAAFIFFLSSFISFAQTIDNHFTLDQVGYRPNDRKICVISNPQTGYNAPDPYTPGATLEVRKQSDNSSVFSGTPVAWNSGATHTQSGDKAWWFDFSAVTAPDDYYIYDAANNTRSYTFSVRDDVYNDALKHAMRFFYYQRCGTAKTSAYAGSNYTDVACHAGSMQDLNCRDVTQPSNASLEKDLSGGWHDAGDYNKYTNFCFATVHYLLDAYEQNPKAFKDNYNIPESGNGIPDILDELKYELDWLLKMQNSDGSVLMKVSTQGFTGGSPPSTDTPQRFYGPAASSATRTCASLFAHASIVFNTIPSLQSYASTLLAKAQLAWTWLQNNPGTSSYNNSGFSSANPEVSAYHQNATSLTAAVYLYAATGNSSYRTYVDNNYNINPLQWTYWYPFESVFQDALLYYCKTPGATASVVNAIQSNCIQSVSSNNPDLLPAYNNQTDAYMAEMQDNDYVWGNNQFKCETGSILYNMVLYNLDPANQTKYGNAAEGYIHYLHGVNPHGIAFLTNAAAFGGDNFTQEIYHSWFGDGTQFDGGVTPYIGAPPAFIPGGVNKNYQPDAAYSGPPIAPPQNQPVQKSYKDWNTSWPENSWEISEVGIYVNAAYVKLLSKFADTSSVTTSADFVSAQAAELDLMIYPNPASSFVSVTVSKAINLDLFSIVGEKVISQRLILGKNNVNISKLPMGIYFCRISNEKFSKTEKLIITR